MVSDSSRRRWLQLCGTGAVFALAGCAGDDADDATDDDPADDSADDAASDPTDDTSGPGDDDPADPDDDDSADPDGDDPADPDDDDSTDPDDGDPVDGLTFGDVYAVDLTSFVMEFEFTYPEQVTGKMVTYEDDVYGTWSADGVEVEIYEVGDYLYQVMDGDCFKHQDERDGEFIDPDDEPDDDLLTLPVAGTTTIDGEEVYVFEDDDQIWYVSTATGYPVRAEIPEGVVDYHSWGQTDPITPPDMECTDYTDR